MNLDYKAETVGDYGNITGDGLGNLLGAPKLEPLELLVREAVQNSWDARKRDSDENIEFKLDFRQLSSDERAFLNSAILRNYPPELAHLRNQDEIEALIVADRNTRGLAGPIRPGEPTDGRSDFVNFVYMIGETKPQTDDKGNVSGGSYGYGRSSFFRASKPRTILVHSRVETDDTPESRFVAISWLDRYEAEGKTQFTGRHWWGEEKGDGWVGPVLGKEADEVARSLGMPIPTGEETGTTVMVLEPALSSVEAYGAEEQSSDESGDASPLDRVLSSVLWNCWPRMLAGGIAFDVTWNGEEVEVPDPREHPRLKYFARAFDTLRGQREETPTVAKYPIKILSPKAKLGEMGIARCPFSQGFSRPDPSAPVEPDEQLQHIALMRHTLLVLRYERPSGARPREGEQFVGAFLTEKDVEDTFAKAEPPSHNDWVKERLSDRTERSFVNVAFTRIKEKTQEFIGPSEGSFESRYNKSMARVADRLGSLLPGLDEAAGPNSRSTDGGGGGGGGGGAGGSGPSIQLQTPEREFLTDRIRLRVPVSFEHVRDTDGTIVSFEVKVVTAGNAREGSPPEGRGKPKVELLEYSGGKQVSNDQDVDTGALFAIPSDIESAVLVVTQPKDCVVNIVSDAEAQ